MRSLDARPDLPEDLRGKVGDHLAMHRRWTRDRERVAAFLERAEAAQAAHDSLPLGTFRWGQPAEPPPGWDDWRREAGAVLDEAKALGKDIPGADLAAHPGAAGAGPDAVDEHERRIADRIETDEAMYGDALAERQRLAGEHERAVQEAERLKREAGRKRDRNEGGGRSM